MTSLIAWIAFPLLLALGCLGAGLLLERAAGRPLPGVLLLPAGFVVLVVATQLATNWAATAPFATALTVAIAAVGLWLGRRRLRVAAIDWWAVGAAGAVFCIFGAPVFLSGEATFAGYGLLGDTSVHFVLIDRLMSHGHDVSGLAPSSYQGALESYFDTGYPTGAHTVLGALRPLTGQDVAWVYQPYLAALVAMVALVLYSIAKSMVESRPLRALVVLIASQPALVFAYSMQGSIKELATILCLALLAALAVLVIKRRDDGLRRLLPLAVASAASIEVLGVGVIAWLGPLLVAVLAALLWIRPKKQRLKITAIETVAFAAVTAVLALPALQRLGSFLNGSGALTKDSEIGNLQGPLDKLQAFGVWPVGDYRLPPDGFRLVAAHALITLVALSAIYALVWSIRRRAWTLPLYLGVSAIGCLYAIAAGSPWVDAKSLMIISTPIMFTSMTGVAVLFSQRRRVIAVGLAAAIAFGVLWSNALAFHAVRLAPQDRFAELSTIDDRIGGEGPTMYNEFEEFSKHFLRGGDPTGWSEVFGPTGRNGRFGQSTSLDQVPIAQFPNYRTIVVRKSPLAARPPADYERTYSGRFYETWQRKPGPTRVVASLPIDSPDQTAGRPPVSELRKLAATARRAGARLAYVQRSTAIVIPASSCVAPVRWDREGSATGLNGPGRMRCNFSVAAPGQYSVWVAGSFTRPLQLTIDGRPVARIGDQRNGPPEFARFGSARLARGDHTVQIIRGSGNLVPGDGAKDLITRIVLDRGPEAAARVRYLPASQWRRLLGQDLDWVEAVRG